MKKENEEVKIDELLQAMTYEGEREIKSTHKFPPLVGKSYHVFRQDDETRAKIQEELESIRDTHGEDEQFSNTLVLVTYFQHLTDLPKEILTTETIDRIMAKPNRKFEEMVNSLVEEITQTMNMSLTTFNALSLTEKIKELG